MKDKAYLEYLQSDEVKEMAAGMEKLIEDCYGYMRGENKNINPLDAFIVQLMTRDALQEREADLKELALKYNYTE